MLNKQIKLCDIHTHPFSEYYENPVEEVQNNIDLGVEKLFFTSCNWQEMQEVMAMQKLFPQNIFAILGVHPSVVKEEDFSQLEKNLIASQAIAIGEIGLDYYHSNNPDKQTQIAAFLAQANIAIKLNLPIVVHLRDAFEDMYQIIKEHQLTQKTKLVFHTFSGDKNWAQKFLELDCYFSFSGVATFKNGQSTVEAISHIPLDRIFIETDAPYLTPHPFRGKQNHSHYVKYVYEKVAQIKNITIEELAQQVEQNIKKVFRIG